jgi:DNA-binding HxlR family transcriptional regulator
MDTLLLLNKIFQKNKNLQLLMKKVMKLKNLKFLMKKLKKLKNLKFLKKKNQSKKPVKTQTSVVVMIQLPLLKILKELTVLKIKKLQLLDALHLSTDVVKMVLLIEIKMDLIVHLKKKFSLMKTEMKSLMIIFV